MEEIWKEIEGYEGIYEVSNLGRVKAVSRIKKSGFGGRGKTVSKERILKESHSYGYPQVVLRKDGIRKGYRTHILVAKSFIPNPENKPEVDHINTIRTDNRVENLRWVTSKENMNNSITKEKFKGRQTRLGSHQSDETRKKISKAITGKHWKIINNKRVWY